MSEGFLARAKEQAQHGLAQGKQKVDEMQQQRAGNDLLRKLGAAFSWSFVMFRTIRSGPPLRPMAEPVDPVALTLLSVGAAEPDVEVLDF